MDKKADYKRSSVRYRIKGNAIEIEVEASDPVALVASLNSSIKQLRIISSVDSAITKLAKKQNHRSAGQTNTR